MKNVLRSIPMTLFLSMAGAAVAGSPHDVPNGSVAIPLGAKAAAVKHLTSAEAAYAKQDYATALKLWQALGEKGDAHADFWVGLMHENGLGVPKSYAEALRWYRIGADHGDKDAALAIGNIYWFGRGAQQSFADAFKWDLLAAEWGSVRAQIDVGSAYESGQGVSTNYIQAYMWFDLAAAKGSQYAARARDAIAFRMTSEQITEAQRLAREWKPAICRNDCSRAAARPPRA